MKDEDKKPMTEEQFTRFGKALMQVSKEELAEVIAAEEKRERPTNRGRPRKKDG